MITNTAFTGEVPSTIPRLLPNGAAQIAKNCKLVDGSLTPLRYPGFTRVTAPSSVMFYVKNGVWFEWNVLVDVAPAPIAANRLYITGDGAPQLVVDSSTIFPLALNPPAGALTASVTGTPDPATQNYYLYSYTYLTQYGEESQPATLSNLVLRSYGQNVTLTGFEATLQVRGITSINIYRSQTGASGATNLYFVNNIPGAPPSSWVDVVETNIDQQLLPSLNFDPPVDALSGIIALPNGIMAAFSGKNLYFSQPWEPHAWPQMYSLATDYNIVGIAAFGQSIAVMTDGYPYVVTGINPSAMTMERLDVNYPCVSKPSIVNLGYSVAYASTDGLVSISGQGAQLVSQSLFTRDEWRKMNPKTFVSAQYMGLYVFCYSYVDSSNATVKGSILIDMTGAQPFLTRSDLYSTYLFFEVGAGKLYLLMGNAIGEFDALNSSFMSMTWRTKLYVLPGQVNYGACFFDGAVMSSGYGPLIGLPTLSITDANVTAAIYPVTDSSSYGFPPPPPVPAQFSADIISDGAVTTTITAMNAVERLTSGFLARTWEIEISGINQITSLSLAGSPFEFQVQQ